MRRQFPAAAGLAFALALAACSPEPKRTPPAPPQPALAPQDELARTCRVCVVDKGEKIEEYLPSRLDLQRDGRTYRFCSDTCRRQFDAEPERYLLHTD